MMSEPDENGMVFETFTVRTTPEKVEAVWKAIINVVHERRR